MSVVARCSTRPSTRHSPVGTTKRSQETKVQPLSQPEIDLSKFEDGEPIDITAELDVRPELTVPDVSTIEVTVEDAAVSDEDVDEQLAALQERFATFAEVDRPVADGDFLTDRPVRCAER